MACLPSPGEHPGQGTASWAREHRDGPLASTPIVVAPKGGGRYMSYIDVEDVDGLWAELKPKLDLLPPGHVEPPCDQEYGQREFAVIGPDGDLIAFGQSIQS